MQSIIDRLCAGDLHPLYVIAGHRDLLGKLEPHLSPELMQTVTQQLSYDTFSMFHAGFCLGTQLTMEVFSFEDI